MEKEFETLVKHIHALKTKCYAITDTLNRYVQGFEKKLINSEKSLRVLAKNYYGRVNEVTGELEVDDADVSKIERELLCKLNEMSENYTLFFHAFDIFFRGLFNCVPVVDLMRADAQKNKFVRVVGEYFFGDVDSQRKRNDGLALLLDKMNEDFNFFKALDVDIFYRKFCDHNIDPLTSVAKIFDLNFTK